MSGQEQTQLELGMDVFHFDDEHVNFNDLSRENGFTHWYARDLMQVLGYVTYHPFLKAINKAIQSCMTINVEVMENFTKVKREVDGETVDDYKLSRFACYLVTMNADVKKPEVANAQAWFAASAEAIRRYVDSAEDVERIIIRDEISGNEKSLSSTAKRAGVSDYALFHNAGCRGLYNMNLNALKDYKGHTAKGRSLLDFMGKDELAANLFRLTQTELKLKNDGVTSQRGAELAAKEVGRRVRKVMVETGGQKPEDMPLSEDIKKVRTSLRQTHKGLKKLDEDC